MQNPWLPCNRARGFLIPFLQAFSGKGIKSKSSQRLAAGNCPCACRCKTAGRLLSSQNPRACFFFSCSTVPIIFSSDSRRQLSLSLSTKRSRRLASTTFEVLKKLQPRNLKTRKLYILLVFHLWRCCVLAKVSEELLNFTENKARRKQGRTRNQSRSHEVISRHLG